LRTGLKHRIHNGRKENAFSEVEDMSMERAWSTEAKALEVVSLGEGECSTYGYDDRDGLVTWSFFDESGELVASVTINSDTGEVVE
jgi:hypothetical protein